MREVRLSWVVSGCAHLLGVSSPEWTPATELLGWPARLQPRPAIPDTLHHSLSPSLSLESSTQRQINRNAFAFPCLGFHSLPSPEDCFTVVSKSLSTRCLSPLPFLGKGDLSWPTDTARQILPSLSSLDKIQYLETKEYLHGCPLFSCICYSL